MTDRALLQQALEALQAYGAHTPNCDHLMLLLSLPPQRKPCSCGLVATMQALRERLAQPEQEPDIYPDEAYEMGLERIAYYTIPPQRKPLPTSEVERLIYEHTKINPNVADDRELLGYIVNAARAIEAAHGIKGEA